MEKLIRPNGSTQDPIWRDGDLITAPRMNEVSNKINQIIDMTTNLEDNVMACVAPAYINDDAEVWYTKGMVVNYDGKLYQCIADGEINGQFDPSKWEKVSVVDVAQNWEDAWSTLETEQNTISDALNSIKTNFSILQGDLTERIDITDPNVGVVKTGGLVGTIEGTLTPTGSSGYRYIIIDNPNVQCEITTEGTQSSTYTHYIFGLDDSNQILQWSEEDNKQLYIDENLTHRSITYTIFFNNSNIKKIAIMATATNNDIFYQRVIIKKSVTSNKKSLADAYQLIEKLHAGTPDFDINASIQKRGWDAAQQVLASMYDYDILFTIITDAHTTGYGEEKPIVYQDTFKLINRINALPCIDFCVNLGDSITASKTTTRTQAIKQLQHVMDELNCEKMYFCIGNHEKNAKYENAENERDLSQVLSSHDLYNILLKKSGVIIDENAAACVYNGNVYNNLGSYYYFDMPVPKIRFAFLNGYDTVGEHYGFNTQEQINFLNNQIFANDDYKVLLFAHNFRIEDDDNDLIVSEAFLNSLKTHSQKIIGLISGHRHTDLNDTTIIDNNNSIIPYHVINSTYRNIRNKGMNQLTINIVGIRTADNTITFKRIGFNEENANWEYNYNYNEREEVIQ